MLECFISCKSMSLKGLCFHEGTGEVCGLLLDFFFFLCGQEPETFYFDQVWMPSLFLFIIISSFVCFSSSSQKEAESRNLLLLLSISLIIQEIILNHVTFHFNSLLWGVIFTVWGLWWGPNAVWFLSSRLLYMYSSSWWWISHCCLSEHHDGVVRADWRLQSSPWQEDLELDVRLVFT